MPISHCPHCRAELDIDDADIGYRVQCPACQSAFTPEREPAAAPPEPPAPPVPVAPPAEEPDRGASSEATDDGTKVVTCPECNGRVGVLEEDLGHDMRCPLCDKVFTATLGERRSQTPRRDGNDNPPWRRSRSSAGDLPPDGNYRRSRYDDEVDDRPRRRRRSHYDDEDTASDLIANAKQECSASGTGLIVVGVITLLLGVLRFGLGIFGLEMGANAGAGPGAGGENSDAVMIINMGYGVYSLMVGVFWIYCGMQLKQVKQYGVCMVGCVMALIPGVSPCCILGLIFGIMGLVKLSDSRVKRGFEANKPGYQSDGYN